MKHTKMTKELFLQIKDEHRNDMQQADVPNEAKYHLEGDAWTHSMMVYTASDEMYKSVALCHDLGKPLAKEIIDNKVKYSGHEGISTLLASKYNLTDDELYCINYHGILWQKSPKQIKKYFNSKQGQDILRNVVKFSTFDTKGNISFEDEKDNKKLNKLQEMDYTINSILNSDFENINQTNRPTMYIMTGIPNSGKSTYTENNLKGVRGISRDNILMDYAKDKNIEGTYSDIWKHLTNEEQKEIDKLLQKSLTEAKRGKDDFIVDMTNMSWKSRKRLYGSKNHRIELITFLTDLETCITRNSKRDGKFIPYNVLLSMSKRLELPLYGEDVNIENIKIM